MGISVTFRVNLFKVKKQDDPRYYPALGFAPLTYTGIVISTHIKLFPNSKSIGTGVSALRFFQRVKVSVPEYRYRYRVPEKICFWYRYRYRYRHFFWYRDISNHDMGVA